MVTRIIAIFVVPNADVSEASKAIKETAERYAVREYPVVVTTKEGA